MKKFKKTNYKFWHSPVVLIVVFFILVIFGYKIVDLIKKDIETARKKELVINEINSLKEREVSLNKDISKLKTDEGKEQIIREKYQVAKEGEKMVTIVEENNKTNSQPGAKSVRNGFWNWIKKVFN